ncbi:MAG: GNAT family N-acetyltransferase [Clostridia bacterium]|nr:GNAT family N-acetyltransferase [Clostridia bacterium]
MELSLRPAIPEEIPIYEQFIKQAIDFQHGMGLVQWSKDYPTAEIIADDIEQKIGFAFTVDGKAVGYCALSFGGDKAYEMIDGKWKTDLPYAVVHRLMFGDIARGKGYALKAFSLIKEYCKENGFRVIKIDTKEDNSVMRHILEKQGFVYCGTVWCNGIRMAYELDFGEK